MRIREQCHHPRGVLMVSTLFSHRQNNCVVTRNYFARASLPNRSDAESAAWRALRERTVSARSRVDAAWTKKQIERAGWDFEGNVCHL